MSDFKEENDYIKQELLKVGIELNDIYDLVNTNKKYPFAIPKLQELLKYPFKDIKNLEGVIRALAVKEAREKNVGKDLIELYNRLDKKYDDLRWVIGNTINVVYDDSLINDVIKIVEDYSNQYSRLMFILALSKSRSKRSDETLIKLLQDSQAQYKAIISLRRKNCIEAKTHIEKLINHPNKDIRVEAEKYLTKINKIIEKKIKSKK